MDLSDAARERKRLYEKEYYQRNKDKILQQRKDWRSENAEKTKTYNQRYWEKKAEGI